MEIFQTINITYLLAVIGIIFSVYKYLDSKNREQNRQEFNQYHKLIKDLVEPDNPQKGLYIDRQAAIVYELRHFKRYYPFTLRTMLELQKLWGENKDQNKRVLQEIELTIKFLKTKVK